MHRKTLADKEDRLRVHSAAQRTIYMPSSYWSLQGVYTFTIQYQHYSYSIQGLHLYPVPNDWPQHPKGKAFEALHGTRAFESCSTSQTIHSLMPSALISTVATENQIIPLTTLILRHCNCVDCTWGSHHLFLLLKYAKAFGYSNPINSRCGIHMLVAVTLIS